MRIGKASLLETTDQGIEKLVNDVVRHHLSTHRILSIHVTPGYDHDGDPILRINVVFRTAPSPHDAPKMIRLLSDLVTKLQQANCESFPIISYFSRKDSMKLQLAAE